VVQITSTAVLDAPQLNAIELVPAQPSAPAPPTGLTATGTAGTVLLNWGSSPGADSYNVKRSSTAGGPYTTIQSGVLGTAYTDASVVHGTTYYYVVTAVNSLGESGNSNEASATPTSAIRINCGGAQYTAKDG